MSTKNRKRRSLLRARKRLGKKITMLIMSQYYKTKIPMTMLGTKPLVIYDWGLSDESDKS